MVRWDKEAGILHVGGESDFLQDSSGLPASNRVVSVPGPSCCSCPPTPGPALLGHARPAPAASGAGWIWGSERGSFNLGAPYPSWDESRLEFWLGVCPSKVLPSWGESRPGSGRITKLKLWLESSTTFRLLWLGIRLSHKPLWWSLRKRLEGRSLVLVGQELSRQKYPSCKFLPCRWLTKR